MSHQESYLNRVDRKVSRLRRHIDLLATEEGGPTLDVVRFGAYEYDPVVVYAQLIDTSSPYEGPMNQPDTYALDARCLQDGTIIEALNVRAHSRATFGFEATIGEDELILPSSPDKLTRAIDALITSFYLRYGVDSLVKQVRKQNKTP